MLTTSIVNKILHVPTVSMKEVAGRDQCYLYVDAVRTLFDLDADEDGDERGRRRRRRRSRTAAAPADGRDAAAAAGATVQHLRGTGTEDA